LGPGAARTLGELARVLGATLEGDAGLPVRGVAPLETATPEDIAFLLDRRYQGAARASRAGALVVGLDAPDLGRPVLRVAEPRAGLIALLRLFHPPLPVTPGVHPLACVDATARVDPTAAVGPFAVVEREAVVGRGSRVAALAYVGPGAVIGEAVEIHPHVVVRDGVRVGDRVILHPGVVLGADGFGYAWDGTGHQKIPQVGRVRIEDDVEIGANTTVDRATLGETVIGRGTKVDNLVQIGHNTQVGEDAILVAQVGISGSCRIGRRAVLAGQVGLADHVGVGEGAVLIAQSGVASDVPAGEVWAGTPAHPAAETRRIWAAERLLPDLVRRVRALERRLEDLGRGGA
jgi:UDP-3-O-[3-hydroxymyristoyl] glucosamine N-acyltransferase